jgi:mannose-6-phosphate isomerase-like protein (cupin superfamily)
MLKRSMFSAAALAALAVAAGPASAQTVPLAQRIGHYVAPTVQPPSRPPGQGAHQGVGRLSVTLNMQKIPGWQFFQRGVLWPHSSIGEHFHNGTEEMFVILDGDAQFTIDGRTSVVKGPAAVPVRLTHAHAVYNPTDKPMQWMNLSVSAKNGGVSFENGDARADPDIKLDPVPQFVFEHINRAQLLPVKAMDGGAGSVMYRRLFGPGVFSTLWAYTDQMVVPPGASIGPRKLADISEVYYVLAGAGTVTVGNETVPVKTGDAIPVAFGETRSFTQTGGEPMELFVNGVARSEAVKDAIVDPYPPPRRVPAPDPK